MAVAGREIAAGEDVRRRKGGGCAYAVEEEDLTLGRDEKDTVEMC